MNHEKHQKIQLLQIAAFTEHYRRNEWTYWKYEVWLPWMLKNGLSITRNLP